MLINRRTKIVAASVAVLTVAGAAGAIAASGALSPAEESQAVVNDAAKQLGVEPARLTGALKQALKNRVDAAVNDGSLTQAQGTALKARIDAGNVPLFGFGRHGDDDGPGLDRGDGRFPGSTAAASYLGLTAAELQTALSSGKTLAQAAGDKNKSVEGLVDAMVAGAEKDLAQAVKDGRLTEAQKTAIMPTVKDRVTAKVNGQLDGGRDGDRDGPGRFGRFGPDRGFGPPGADGALEPDSGASTEAASYTI